MITLRTRLFIIISIVVLLVLVIGIGLLWYGKRAPTPTPGGETPSTTIPAAGGQNVTGGGAVPGAITGLPVQPITTEATEKNAVKQLAKVFIERYGSYSTDSDYQNIIELESLVTEKLWATLSKKIGTPITGSFMGMTTRAVAAALTDWKKDQSATVGLQVVQTEEKNGGQNVLHKNIDIKFLKVKDAWLVDSFGWGK